MTTRLINLATTQMTVRMGLGTFNRNNNVSFSYLNAFNFYIRELKQALKRLIHGIHGPLYLNSACNLLILL
jgi:hypothetical protein